MKRYRNKPSLQTGTVTTKNHRPRLRLWTVFNTLIQWGFVLSIIGGYILYGQSIPRPLTVYLAAVNAGSFLVYGYDKSAGLSAKIQGLGKNAPSLVACRRNAGGDCRATGLSAQNQQAEFSVYSRYHPHRAGRGDLLAVPSELIPNFVISSSTSISISSIATVGKCCFMKPLSKYGFLSILSHA